MGESTYEEVAGTTSYKVAAENYKLRFSSDPDYAKHLISIIETHHLSNMIDKIRVPLRCSFAFLGA